MAKVGLWKRVSNLWRGFVSGWLTDAEKQHPSIAYENAIDSMIGKYRELKGATAAIVRRREDLTSRVERSTSELVRVGADLSTAVATQQDDLALMLIERKQALELEVHSLHGELEQARGDAEEAKSSLMSVKHEIEKLKVEKDRMLARMQSAQARLQIQEQLEGLSVDAEVRALETVREHIHTTVAEAKLGAELRGADLHQRLERLRAESIKSAARAELSALKAAAAQVELSEAVVTERLPAVLALPRRQLSGE